MKKYVASTTLDKADWTSSTVIKGDLVEEVTTIKQQPGQDILMDGFGPVAHTPLEHDVLDELRFWVHPIFVGSGTPQDLLFRECPKTRLTLWKLSQVADQAFLPAVYPTLILVKRYFARAMLDGSPAAASMFDDMVEVAEQWLTRHHPGQFADPRPYAAVLVGMQVGLLVVHDHLSRALGADVLSPEGYLRMSKPVVDLYSHALLSPDLAAQAHAAYDRLQAQRPPTAAQPRSPSEGAPR